MVIFTGLFYLNTTLINDSAGLLDSFPKLSVDFYNLPRHGFWESIPMQLTHKMFIHFFIPTKKPSSRRNLQVLGYQWWVQLGSNQRLPDYELTGFLYV